MINYLSEADILTVIFLDNISNYFLSKMNYYISSNELQELYEISCETLEYNKNLNEFHEFTQQLLNFGIIRPSKRVLRKIDAYGSFNNVNNDLFFILINPKQIKVVIDTIFNQ